MATPDAEAVQAFAGRLLGIYTGSVLAKLIRIGYVAGFAGANGNCTAQKRSAGGEPWPQRALRPGARCAQP